jgi:hypothetical protein
MLEVIFGGRRFLGSHYLTSRAAVALVAVLLVGAQVGAQCPQCQGGPSGPQLQLQFSGQSSLPPWAFPQPQAGASCYGSIPAFPSSQNGFPGTYGSFPVSQNTGFRACGCPLGSGPCVQGCNPAAGRSTWSAPPSWAVPPANWAGLPGQRSGTAWAPPVRVDEAIFVRGPDGRFYSLSSGR